MMAAAAASSFSLRFFQSRSCIASRLSARLAESVSGIRTVKAFGRTDEERVRLDELNREVMSLEDLGGYFSNRPFWELLFSNTIVECGGPHQGKCQ